MSRQELIGKLTLISAPEERWGFLRDHFQLDDEGEREQVVSGLLEKVVELMRVDVKLSIEFADLLLAYATLSGNPLHRAVGLRAKAQAIGNGRGHYRESLTLFEEAIDIHRLHQDDYGEALVCLTYIWALAHAGRTQEAIQRGEWALSILREKPDLGKLASMFNNLGLVQNRVGHYAQANEMFSQAVHLYHELGGAWLSSIPTTENNRAFGLFHLGQFRKAAEVATHAVTLAETYTQNAVLARGQHILGMIRFFQGKYNEALRLYDNAIAVHQTLEQGHEIALCKLSKTDCWLELRQFKEVIKLCEELKPIFLDLNLRIEMAETIRNQATALVGLKRYPPAILALEEARQLFLAEGHWLRATYAEFQKAICFHQQRQIPESVQTALACAATFDQHSLPLDGSLARLLAGWGWAEEGRLEEARALVEQVWETIQTRQWPRVRYQVFHLQGHLAKLRGENAHALADLSRAVKELENLRGNAMVEHRVNFVEDKQVVYEEIVNLWIVQGEVEKGLEYVERAKSRTLVELVKARARADFETYRALDDPLVEMLQNLRATREQKLRSVLAMLEAPETEGQGERADRQRDIQELEDQITELWHQWLIRHQVRGRDVVLGDVKVATLQAYLDADTLLVEYFVAEDQLLVFTVGRNSEQYPSQVFRLSASPAQVTRLLQQLNLNFNLASSGTSPDEGLIRHAQGYLHRLYQWLVLPIAQELKKFKKLIIVPYASLHAVPFHALYDSQQYLIENYTLSYLPAATLLSFCKETKPAVRGSLTIGHSLQGKLPYAVEEAQYVAALWGTPAFCDERARLSTLRTEWSTPRLIHIACHGDYHQENALFSGLMLEDGALTTLDVFGLRLHASLVTLSACQTGRSIIGGGDELLGLTRAFLAAGAISLLMTLWSVSDRSTIAWMERFYTLLKEGKSKGEAIQRTQMEFLAGQGDFGNYRHPFFWAPFFLTGDDGML